MAKLAPNSTKKFLLDTKYVGDFELDKMQGEGVMDFGNGEKYEGEFYDGEANGKIGLKFIFFDRFFFFNWSWFD